MKFAAFVLLVVAFPGFLWAAPRTRRSLNLPTSTLSEYDIKDVINNHNKRRRYVNAADMEYMTWDQELADAAQSHVDKCVFQHGTQSWPGMSFDTVGQNMFFANFFAVEPGFMVAKWYGEKDLYDYDTSTCAGPDGKGCGHYLQVVWANTNKVGCAKKVCENMVFPDQNRNVSNALFFTCNYNPASYNYLEKPYQTGDLCTKCASGKQWCEDGLCRDCNLLESTEDECECNLRCENCGVKNEANCSCTCPAGYIGTSCDTECSDLSEHCGTTWPAWTCDLPEAQPTVHPKCPKMCGLCKPPTIDVNTCIDKREECAAKDCGAHGVWDDVQCKCLCTTGHYGDQCQNTCPTCFDAYPDICPKWKEKCKDCAHKKFMDLTCAKTCGSCTTPEGC